MAVRAISGNIKVGIMSAKSSINCRFPVFYCVKGIEYQHAGNIAYNRTQIEKKSDSIVQFIITLAM